MGNAFWNALGIQTEQQFAEYAEREFTETRRGIQDFFRNAEAVVQDTERTAAQVIDNARGDVMYTVRDTKTEFLHTVDSAIDNFAFVVQDIEKNISNTVQMATLLGLGGFIIFIILYGDKIFDRPIALGKLSLF
jgi:hypothetical protein